jgi:hypothetical protein
MKPGARWTIATLGVAAVAIQFVPVDRTNPPVEGAVFAPAEVESVLRRACYDCHSNETNWPWYSHVAPISWLTAHDVHEGRDALNFSTWSALDRKAQLDAIGKSWEEVQDHDMPPWYYLPLHWNAHLSSEDRAVVRGWSLLARQR